MQKVVGSSPIIRSSEESPANVGLSPCLGHYAQGTRQVFGNEKGNERTEKGCLAL
jgi:hypothetical protein